MTALVVIPLLATSLFGASALMPMPGKVSFEGRGLAITAGFRIAAGGFIDDRLKTGIDRLTDRISRQTGIPFFPGGEAPALIIVCQESGAQTPALGEDESYRLDVSAEAARLEARTVIGALRGM